MFPLYTVAQKNWTPEPALKIKNISSVLASQKGSNVVYTVPVRMRAMPRQGHGPEEPTMVLKTMQTNGEWFEKYIGEKKEF